MSVLPGRTGRIARPARVGKVSLLLRCSLAEVCKPSHKSSCALTRWQVDRTPESPILHGLMILPRRARRTQIGGSARGYQPGLRVVGWLPAAVTGHRTSHPLTVYLCIGALGASFRFCRWCAGTVQPGRGVCRRTWPCATRVNPSRSPRPSRRECGGGHLASLAGSRDPGGRGAAGPHLGPGDVGARGGADLGPQSRGPAASGHGPFRGHEEAGRQGQLQGRAGHPGVPERDAPNPSPRGCWAPTPASCCPHNHMIARRLSHAELRTLQTGNDCGPEVGSISQA